MANSILTGAINKWQGIGLLSRLAWSSLILWSAFWIWFNLASGISEIAEHGAAALLFHLVMPALIIAVLYVCWNWQGIGGLLLILLASLMFLGFGWRGWDLTLILQAPIVLLGLLMIIGNASNRSRLAAAS